MSLQSRILDLANRIANEIKLIKASVDDSIVKSPNAKQTITQISTNVMPLEISTLNGSQTDLFKILNDNNSVFEVNKDSNVKVLKNVGIGIQPVPEVSLLIESTGKPLGWSSAYLYTQDNGSSLSASKSANGAMLKIDAASVVNNLDKMDAIHIRANNSDAAYIGLDGSAYFESSVKVGGAITNVSGVSVKGRSHFYMDTSNAAQILLSINSDVGGSNVAKFEFKADGSSIFAGNMSVLGNAYTSKTFSIGKVPTSNALDIDLSDSDNTSSGVMVKTNSLSYTGSIIRLETNTTPSSGFHAIRYHNGFTRFSVRGNGDVQTGDYSNPSVGGTYLFGRGGIYSSMVGRTASRQNPADYSFNGSGDVPTMAVTGDSDLTKDIFQCRLGGGTSSTVFTVNYQGNVSCNSLTQTSDIRVKDNLQIIKNALDKVGRLNGYTYNRKDLDNEQQAGLVAQEVKAVLPQATKQKDDELKTLQLNDAAVTALLVEAIKELKKENVALLDSVGELKNEISKLKLRKD